MIPEPATRKRLDSACQAVFRPDTTLDFVRAIEDLKARGADCVILGCTEIPLIITADNSPLPILDSTRLLARYAVREAVDEQPIDMKSGWLPMRPPGSTSPHQ